MQMICLISLRIGISCNRKNTGCVATRKTNTGCVAPRDKNSVCSGSGSYRSSYFWYTAVSRLVVSVWLLDLPDLAIRQLLVVYPNSCCPGCEVCLITLQISARNIKPHPTSATWRNLACTRITSSQRMAEEQVVINAFLFNHAEHTLKT